MGIDNLKPQPAVYVNPVKPFNGSDHKKLLGLDIEEINENIFQSKHRPIKYIYIDLMMLRDVYLGALLNIVTPTEYEYILANIEKYNDRILDEDILYYFPNVTSVSMSDVLEYINDTNNTLMLSITSPVSYLYETLPYMLRLMMQHNSVMVGRSNCSNITICINTYPLPTSKQVKDVYNIILKSIHPDFKLQYTSTPLHTIDDSSLLIGSKPKYMPMFIYDMISFIDVNSKSYSSFVRKMTYHNCQIYSPRRIDKILYADIVKSGKPLEDIFRNTEAVLSLSCEFRYLDISVKI